MPDGGTSCVDGGPAPAQPDGNLIKPIRLPLLSRMSAEARKKFGSADCVIDNSGRPSSPPPILPRRARRSLPCRAASVNDYAAELQLQQNRVLIRRQSQPEYVGVARYVGSFILVIVCVCSRAPASRAVHSRCIIFSFLFISLLLADDLLRSTLNRGTSTCTTRRSTFDCDSIRRWSCWRVIPLAAHLHVRRLTTAQIWPTKAALTW